MRRGYKDKGQGQERTGRCSGQQGTYRQTKEPIASLDNGTDQPADLCAGLDAVICGICSEGGADGGAIGTEPFNLLALAAH